MWKKVEKLISRRGASIRHSRVLDKEPFMYFFSEKVLPDDVEVAYTLNTFSWSIVKNLKILEQFADNNLQTSNFKCYTETQRPPNHNHH